MSAQEMAAVVQRLADTVAHRLDCAVVRGPGCTCGAWRDQTRPVRDALRVVRELRGR